MKISYAVTVCNEFVEIQNLITFLLEHKRTEDEIVVLYDHENGWAAVEEFLRAKSVNGEFSWHKKEFKGHFAEWKNKLTSLCSGDYIFQIDADEIPNETLLKFLPVLIESNPLNEVYLVPRVNTVEGLTQEHINKWKWNVNEKGWVNWPDYQWRIWKNLPDIKWKNKVHEVLEGFKTYAPLPTEESFALYHPKDIKRQEKQNDYYDTLEEVSNSQQGSKNYINSPLEYEKESFHNFMVFCVDDFAKDARPDWSQNKSIKYIKAQIDNSLAFGWKVEDIILATNFDFEYRGVKSVYFQNESNYSKFFLKQESILELWEKGILHKNIWYHDIDAFQNDEFGFPKFEGDWGQCPYVGKDGKNEEWNCGVVFYKPEAMDILKNLVEKQRTGKYGNCDEVTTRNFVRLSPEYSHRTATLNPTFNMGMSGFETRYSIAHKPVKILHFHPDNDKHYAQVVKGENGMNKPVVSSKLKKVLDKYF